jgi:hypothetical protein
MSLLEKFATQHGLKLCTMQIRNRIHFNPARFPGREPEDEILYEPAIEGKPPANDPEAVKLYIVEASNPLVDCEPESSEELAFLRWDANENVFTHPFSTTDKKKVEKVLFDLGLKGGK